MTKGGLGSPGGGHRSRHKVYGAARGGFLGLTNEQWIGVGLGAGISALAIGGAHMMRRRHQRIEADRLAGRTGIRQIKHDPSAWTGTTHDLPDFSAPEHNPVASARPPADLLFSPTRETVPVKFSYNNPFALK